MLHQNVLSTNGTRVKRVVLLVTCVSFSLSAMDPLIINSSKEELLIDENGFTALHLAARSGNAQEVSELLAQHETSSWRFKTPYIDRTSKDGKTALHVAAYNGHSNCVAVLLEHHETSSGFFKTPYIDRTSKDGKTALHVAAYNGHSNCVAVLLEHKANIKVNTGTITYKEREPIRLGTPLFFAILSRDC